MDSVTEWQHPFVDVFKKYNTFDAPRSYKGDVAIVHDPVIARKCFKLSGPIISNNSITIPDPSSEIKHCNLIGKYLYVEFFTFPQKLFCLHFQIGIKDREPGVRFTLTNMEKQYSVSGGNTLKIPFQLDENSRNLWTILCIDIEHHLQNFGLFSKGVIKNYQGVHTLRGLHVCSNMTIRGIYTSSNVYDWQTLPKQMSLKMVKGGKWAQAYNFVYMPSSINPLQTKKKLKGQTQNGYGDLAHSIVERQEAATTRKKLVQSQQISYHPGVQKLQSQPLLELHTAFSFSSLHNPDLLFKNQNIYYSGGSVLIRKNINTGEQLFLQGHTDFIVAMDSYEDWIVTVQEGPKSGVRIWVDNKCISSFQCPYEKVQQIRLNYKRYLAMVGLDPYKRQAILVFDISEIEVTRKPILLAKQISDFSIISLKFSPVDCNRLVSCGKQNIRFWRIKNQHLPGTPVILNHHARNTIFTVFDFQYAFDDPNPIKQKQSIRRVYVGSNTGLLFQVNYETHQLEEVYKLHDNSAISSIALSAGFCVTGGQDHLLRVWHMDFAEYILEASNDGVVTSLVLNEDSSLVACGTSTGTLSILDLTNSNYKTILRSHTAAVSQIFAHKFSSSMITLSSDLTIRLWDTNNLEQTYQFSYPTTDICTCIAADPNSMHFVAGFKSGVLRIFNIETTAVVQEITHHTAPIIYVDYSEDGHFLSVLDEKVNMLYSPMHSHQPIKHLPVQMPSKYKHSAFSGDSETIAIIGDSGTHINIWQLRSLQMIGKIFVGKVVKKLKFEAEPQSQTSSRLWVICEDTSIRRYNIQRSLKQQQIKIEVEMQALHRQSLNGVAFNLSDYLLYSVGDDSFVKIWDYSFLRQPHQVSIGHANAINDIIYQRANKRLWTVGSQGILVWQAKQALDKFIEPPIFRKQRKGQFIKNTHYDPLRGKDNQNSENVEDDKKIEKNLMKQMKQPKKIMFSALMKKSGNNQDDEFAPQKIDMHFAPKLVNMKKIKKREQKPYLTTKTIPLNSEYNLPLKHFFKEQLEENQIQYTAKIQQIKQNTSKKYSLEFLIGIEPYAHDHIVWNFMYGWYAYVYDNLIVIESLSKGRSQKIITMPQKIGSMTITSDFKKLICVSQFNPVQKEKQADLSGSEDGSQASSSEAGQETQKQTAGIYVLGQDFTIEKKLEFHPRGVQSIALSQNNKLLVSIGNFRECTVCVWEMISGKLKASSYTLDKLNDIAIMNNCGEGRLLEFATVGRDQIHFWAYNKQQKLEYYDVFVKGDHQDQIVELTSCSYYEHDDQNTYLMCGTTTGELLLIRYGTFDVTWRMKICSGQILSIKTYRNRAVIGSADGNLYFWDYSTKILDSEPNPSFNKLNLYYSVTGIYMDLDGNQGVVITTEAVYYVNLVEQMHSLLVGGSPSKVIFVKNINQQFMLTSHQNGRLKLWNMQTAEELKTYKWRYPCIQAYYDDSLGRIVCFCQNQSIKLVNIKKFTKQQNYLPEELVKVSDPKLNDYIIAAPSVQYGGKISRWAFSKQGYVYDLEISLKGKKKVIKLDKVLQLGAELSKIQSYSEKNLLLAISTTGYVSAYNVDHNLDGTYSLLLVDRCAPSEFCLEQRMNKIMVEPDALQSEIDVKICPSKVLSETYLAISEKSKYLYFRNFMKRITYQKISLNSIPTSLYLKQNKKQSEAFVGMQEGSIIMINSIDPELRSKFQGIVNQPLEGLYSLKGKGWILGAYPSAMGIYSMK